MNSSFVIVDPDPTSATVTAALLWRIAPDATIRCATSPERAWHFVQEQPPDALVIDPTPLRALGWLLIQLCREQFPQVRICALASQLTERDAARLRRFRVDLGLEKPSSPERLHAALIGFVHDIEQRRTTRQAA